MKYFSMSLLLGAILFAGFACGNGAVSPGKEFSLRIGESAKIKGEDLQVRFLEVTEDSRCPAGVTCIWEGRVSCLVEITYGKSPERVTLTEPGLTDFPSRQAFHEYTLAYHVEPYPGAGAQIGADEYRLRLMISK